MPGFIPRSCLDYLEHSYHENDFYKLYDDQDQLYVAFCDLSYEPGTAWTLVMSWMTKKYLELPNFKSNAFSEDAPINEYAPNFDIYRQTWFRMNGLRKRSTHWRATCNFHPSASTFGDFQDYLRGKFDDLDIMTLQGHDCYPVEFVNILGKFGGRGTTVGFWQSPGSYCLHIDSSDTGCEFLPLADPTVDYFGYYGDGLSTEFSCSLSEYTTTQWWFGGHLGED